jgi:Ca-activated chloride channel family protein
MVAARKALARMVDTLTDRDRFTVYAFDDRIETPPSLNEGLASATDRNRYRAVEFLTRIEARGGTEMAGPLDRAVQQLAKLDPQRDRILVLVTDGQVGNEDQILQTLGNRLQEMRIFTLGIDQAVNEGFLKRLACLGGGCCELVESEDRLDAVMDRIHRRIGTPVLTGVRVEPAGLEVDRSSQSPARLPDLFEGVPLVLMGRYHGASATGSITISGRDAAGRPWTQTVPARGSDNPALTWAWARGRVRDLEDRYAALGRTVPEKEIVQTSLRFGVLCRFTAFIAVDVKEVVNPGGEVQRIIQPVEPAAGWAMLGTDASARNLTMCSARIGGSRSASAILGSPPPAAPPAPAKARAKQGGYGGVKRQALRESEAASPVPAPPLELTAYRRRALQLRERLQSAGPAERLNELGVLTVQLTELIEDLRTIGATEEVVAPLAELLAEVTSLTSKAQPDAAEVGRLWSRAEAVLAAFGQGSTPAGASAGGKREGFWK